MSDAAYVEVVEDAATDTCLATLWLGPDLAVIAAASGFADVCHETEGQLAELVDEADRNHEDWASAPRLMRYRNRRLRFVDATTGGRSI